MASDTVVTAFFIASLTVWITLLVFASKAIDEKIEENTTGLKRINTRYVEPREWLGQATLFWMVSWLSFLSQLLIQGENIPLFSNADDYGLGVGLVFLGFGVFRTYQIGEFTRRKNYYPRLSATQSLVVALELILALFYGVAIYSLTPFFFTTATWQGQMIIASFPIGLILSLLYLRCAISKKVYTGRPIRILAYLTIFPLYPIVALILWGALTPLL